MPIETETLSRLPLFKGLDTTELEEIASALMAQDVEAGKTLIREGNNEGNPIFVLLSGSVEVVKRGLDGRGHVISTLAAPSVFGEIEILARRAAIATVNAATAVKVAVLSRGVFDEMCNGNRPAALKMVRNLAQVLSYRLAATDDRLAAQFDLSVSATAEKVGQVRQVIYSAWK
ncbi:MAG: cyclic nucleotide-binding domain-containing protein [Deltaproteobacteria bacterium]|nr:cyclic nucleotide-binding domain-containing protein [Deltaproteobacteria bacterium]